MNTSTAFHRCLHRTLATVLIGLIVPVAAASQTSSVVGTVLDETNLNPLPGARIIANGEMVARTDENGNFLIDDLPAGVVGLRVEKEDYSTTVEDLEVFPDEMSFVQVQMLPVATLLREVLVMAGGAGQDRLATVPGGDDANHGTAADLLAQRVPGLHSGRTGNIGQPGGLTIRGVSSFIADNTPLVYLDGVRLANSKGALMNTGSVMAILDDIPATDIRQIRILKGPSAAARFGESANGVILIETVRGPVN